MDGEPQLAVLINRVRAFMEAVGEPQPQHDDPAEWLREASDTLYNANDQIRRGVVSAAACSTSASQATLK